jgi:hypothetical protein
VKLEDQSLDGERNNRLVEIQKYLSTPENPLTSKEFKEFWDSLTLEEKDEFRRAELK